MNGEQSQTEHVDSVFSMLRHAACTLQVKRNTKFGTYAHFTSARTLLVRVRFTRALASAAPLAVDS